MTTISKTISSNKQSQLIDLNGNLVNFKIDYIIESTDNKNFKIGIVSQEQLDDNKPIKYKKSENGKIVGSLENTNNMKENYYIAVESEEEVEINIIIKRTVLHIPKTENFELKDNKDSFMYNYGYIIFIVLIMIGVGIYYYKYVYKPSAGVSDSVDIVPEPDVIPDIVSLTSDTNKTSVVPKVDTKMYSPASSIHSTRSSEMSSPASQRSNISEGCKNAINELMAKCIDL